MADQDWRTCERGAHVGDRLRLSVELLRHLCALPDCTSVEAELTRVRRGPDGVLCLELGTVPSAGEGEGS